MGMAQVISTGARKAFAVVWAAVLVTGCGMNNQLLEANYRHYPIVRSDTDENRTFVRLSEEVSVTTDYSVRYKVSAVASPGDYPLRGQGSEGGRYYQRHVDLHYHGTMGIKNTSQERITGGIYISPTGETSVYWFWNDEEDMVTRVPTAGLKISAVTELDEDRRQARLAREAQLQQAKSAADEKRAEGDRLRAELADAMKRNRLECVGAAPCDRMFAQGQAYLLQHSDMRIQVATNTLIETYNATDSGKVSMRLVRLPMPGDRWDIQVTAACHAPRPQDIDGCNRRLLAIYSGYLRHMQALEAQR
jgi:hypothetical protein